MIQEQKAKAYDEALERAQKATRAGSDAAMDIVQYIFPQLAESEDERIRKALIEVFKKKLERGFEWVEYGIPNRSVLDWLEKQKEQKQGWSEEDELMMKAIIGILDENDHPKLCSWLKSLRPSWKPSEEQMEVLKDYADSAIDSQRDIEGNILFSLYDDLKKLTESNFEPKVPSIKEAVIKIVKSISPKVFEYEGFNREQVVKWLYDKEE